MPEIMEIIENFIKVHLTKLKEKNLTSKNNKNETFHRLRVFEHMFYSKKVKPGNAGNQQKAF